MFLAGRVIGLVPLLDHFEGILPVLNFRSLALVESLEDRVEGRHPDLDLSPECAIDGGKHLLVGRLHGRQEGGDAGILEFEPLEQLAVDEPVDGVCNAPLDAWQRKSENIMVIAATRAIDVVLKAVPISPTTVGSFSVISSNEMPLRAVPKWITVPRNPSTGSRRSRSG